MKDLVKGGVLVKVLNKVAAEFGVNPNKLINDTSLTVSERLSIQRKIRSLTAKTLLNALPEGFNNVAEATGLPNVLLNAKNPETGEPNLLYTKQEQRVKIGKEEDFKHINVWVINEPEMGAMIPKVLKPEDLEYTFALIIPDLE